MDIHRTRLGYGGLYQRPRSMLLGTYLVQGPEHYIPKGPGREGCFSTYLVSQFGYPLSGSAINSGNRRSMFRMRYC
jgi:hypothetical protein